MLGRIIRCPAEDPLKQATLNTNNEPIVPLIRRVGRPRKNWANGNMIDAYNKHAEQAGLQAHDSLLPFITNEEKYIIT